MDTLTFEFKLATAPMSPFVIVAGGADANRDGRIENQSEVDVFAAKGGNLWSRSQTVATPTKGMLFSVTFTIGIGVRWTLEIKNAAGAVLYSGANTTVFNTENVSYVLS
ncbi:MAG: hypothetical protein JNK64_24275 [Myxococcales bacterium]|nr:hypothetical protein [Myxococcales bacterium]